MKCQVFPISIATQTLLRRYADSTSKRPQELWRFTAGSWTRWPTSVVRPGRRAGHVAAWDDVSAALWSLAGFLGTQVTPGT